eukprot:7317436-Lingulodinium_polyedra.AAC.1
MDIHQEGNLTGGWDSGASSSAGGRKKTLVQTAWTKRQPCCWQRREYGARSPGGRPRRQGRERALGRCGRGRSRCP